MKQKSFLFNGLLSLIGASLVQSSYSTENILNVLKYFQDKSFEKKLLTFNYKHFFLNLPSDIKSKSKEVIPFYINDFKEESLEINIYGKVVDESFCLEDFDLPTQQKFYQEIIDFYFPNGSLNKFSFKFFTKPSLRFIHTVLLSNFKLDNDIYGNSFIMSGSPHYKCYLLIANYYNFFSENLVVDLERLALKVLNTDQNCIDNPVNSKFDSLIFMIMDQKLKLFKFEINNNISNLKLLQKKLIKINESKKIIETFKYLISLNNENILNAYYVRFIRRASDNTIFNQIYHEHKNKLPSYLKLTYLVFNSSSTNAHQNLIKELKKLVHKNLDSIILANIYGYIAYLHSSNLSKKIEYFKASLDKFYDYQTVYALSILYYKNENYKESINFLNDILLNVVDYTNYLFTKELILFDYILSLRAFIDKENFDLLKEEKEQQLNQAFLEFQELRLQSQPKFKKFNKDENHKKRIAKLKAALQEYYQEQEKLEQQKKEQALLEQQRKEQFEKDKQTWALEHPQESLLSQTNTQPKRKKKKKKKKISMASVEAALPSVALPTPITQSKEQTFIIVENLLHGNPLKIFYKFFNMGQDQKTDRQMEISMHEFNVLMESLGQKMEPSKGSHKKVTFNFDHLIKESEEQMLIIAKHTYLLPYQIKQIREKFLDYGLCPKELTDKFESQALMIK